MSIASVMPSCYLILWCSLLLLPSTFPSIRDFSNESAVHIRWQKYWSFSFKSRPFDELISFEIDWFDVIIGQGTLRSLLQHHGSKALNLGHTTLFMVQLSQPYVTTGKTISLNIWIFVSRVMYLLFNTPLKFVTAFLPRCNCLLISCLQSPRRGNLSLFHLFSFYFPGSNSAKCHDLRFLMFCFKPGFSLFSFTTSRGSLVPLRFLPLEWYHLHMWGCWYFSLLSWVQLVSHSAWYFSWCTLHRS